MRFKRDVNNTIWLGTFLPLYNADLKLNPKGVIIFEALQFAISKINNQSDLPFGWKFGLRDAVSTSSSVQGEWRTVQYFGNCLFSNVLFSIGWSETSVVDTLDRLTETFHMPVISLSSTSEQREVEKADDIERLVPTTFDYSYQIVPPNYYRYAALCDVIVKLQWNYISVLASNQYSVLIYNFIAMIKEKGNCVMYQNIIDEVRDDLNMDDKMLRQLLSEWNTADKRMKVLVLLTDRVDSRRILKALKQLNLEERFLLIFGMTPMDQDITKDYEKVAVGAFSLELWEHENSEFRDYFLTLNPGNEKTFYFHQYWEQVFQCSLDSEILDANTVRFPRVKFPRKCSGTEKFTGDIGYYPTFGISALVASISLATNVLNEIASIYPYPCTDTPGKNGTVSGSWLRKCPWASIPHIRNTFNYHLYDLSKRGRELILSLDELLSTSVIISITNFQSKYQGYRNVEVGTWKISNVESDLYSPSDTVQKNPPVFTLDTQKIFWRNSAVGVVPSGNCSQKCQPGYVQQNDRDFRIHRCCWKCLACPRNNIVLDNRCVSCKFDEKPNQNRDSCLALPAKYIDLMSPVSIVVLVLSVVGLMLVACIVSIFIRHNDKHVVRASGRDLSYSILAGTALLFACPFLFLKRPGSGICVFRVTLPSLSLLIIFAAIFMKYLRLFRIFVRSKVKLSIARPPLISPVSQVLIVLGIAMLQGVFSGAWFFDKSPDSENVLSENKEFVTLHCVGDEMRFKMIVNCSLALLFMLASCLLAYRVRNELPKNYNESKHIAFTSYLTTASLLAYLPAYVLTPSSDYYYHEFLHCFFCILIGFCVVGCLFGSRIRIILQGKPFEECHDSLRSRARSLTPKSPMKECNMNEFNNLQ